MKTPIVTLTTDWGAQGFFVGMVKGALMHLVDGVQVVDINHLMEAYNIGQASFVVRNACLGFPEGTVHIVDVASQPPFVALRVKGQYFLCADNGLPALAFGEAVEQVVQIPVQASGLYNFAAHSLFVPAAAQLLMGETLDDIGTPYEGLTSAKTPTYVPQEEHYRIYVQYIDRYGNAYLGMTYTEFERLRAGRKFVLQVRELKANKISTSYYQEFNPATPTLQLTVSATGNLELALPMDSLAQYGGLKVGSSVLLEFK